jgi:hypothetical protein
MGQPVIGMIEKLFNHPHLLHQTPDSETDVANKAIAGQIDNGGTIVLSQEGRHICVNRASVPELYKLLKKLATLEVK